MDVVSLRSAGLSLRCCSHSSRTRERATPWWRNHTGAIERARVSVAVAGVRVDLRDIQQMTAPGDSAGQLIKIGKPVGVHATDGATARLYRDGGCSLITVASDGVALSRGTAAELEAVRE